MKPAAQKTVSKPPVDPNVRAAALELERTLGTRVKILGDGRRGKIEISYFSAQDLTRIYDLIVRQ
jgi:ParB family chromosome partitioning protein